MSLKDLGRGRRRRAPALVTAAVALAALTAVPAAAAYAAPARHAHGYDEVDLFSDQKGAAAVTDPNLVNAWGLSSGPGLPLWVSDNGSDASTLYTGGGAGQHPTVVPKVVAIPGGAPTGQVFNPTQRFGLPDGAPAMFVFAGEDGILSAWNRQLTPGTSAVKVATVAGATFKGVALVQGRPGPRLLVADFGLGRIDVFDSAFRLVRMPHGAFTDRHLPAGYAPFNVAAVGDRVFVTYALRAANNDDVSGAGHGFVDVYSTGGRLLQRFASRGVLNSPWAVTVAPKHFGAFSGALLVGNFGDGRIHAFDPRSGRLLGSLRHRNGSEIVIDGLWGLLPGNGTSAGTNDVWFSAGPGDEAHGLLGVLRAAH